MAKSNRSRLHEGKTVTLRTVAERVGLAPCSVSAILNDTTAGRSIPQHTRDRVRLAALQLNYRPNYSARSLRTNRTYTVALLAPDIGHAPAARIVAGAEMYLRRNGYCLMVATYDATPDWLENHFTSLRQRGVEGIVTVQTRVRLPSGFPTVFVDILPFHASEPISEAFQKQLERVGNESAERLVQQIEAKNGGPGRNAVPRLPVHLTVEKTAATYSLTS
jgi:hypothetical protein